MGSSTLNTAGAERQVERLPVVETMGVLLVRVCQLRCAMPLAAVIEQMRPLPIVRLSGQPPFLLGVSNIRGTPTPVVDLGVLVSGGEATTVSRFVTIRTMKGTAALAVGGVDGIGSLEDVKDSEMPALLRHMGEETVTSLRVHDAGLVAVLDATRVVPEEVWGMLVRVRT